MIYIFAIPKVERRSIRMNKDDTSHRQLLFQTFVDTFYSFSWVAQVIVYTAIFLPDISCAWDYLLRLSFLSLSHHIQQCERRSWSTLTLRLIRKGSIALVIYWKVGITTSCICNPTIALRCYFIGHVIIHPHQRIETHNIEIQFTGEIAFQVHETERITLFQMTKYLRLSTGSRFFMLESKPYAFPFSFQIPDDIDMPSTMHVRQHEKHRHLTIILCNMSSS